MTRWFAQGTEKKYAEPSKQERGFKIVSCSSLSPVFSSVNAEAQLIIKRLGRLLGPQGSVVQCVSGGTYLTCADQDAKRLYLWMLLQQRPRQQLEVKHLLYLVSLNKCQAHFCKKKSSFSSLVVAMVVMLILQACSTWVNLLVGESDHVMHLASES